MKKLWKIILVLAVSMSAALSGCGADTSLAENGSTQEHGQDAQEAEENDIPESTGNCSVWNVYWNLDGVEEQIESLSDKICNVNYFAAYFDYENHVFVDKSTVDFYEKTGETYKARGWKCYLTVVNDQILEDGSSSLKSKELLYDILSEQETYEAHAEELISVATQYGYDGLEIDYENIRKDDTLWGYFMPFVEYLYDRCNEEGLLLRVVLETNIDTARIDWVEGPEYVVMCYNLYGSHSEPGPKADKAFIEEIREKMSNVPGNVDYALANGGFDWSSEGTVKSLTGKKAQELLAEYDVTPKRDEDSDVNYFTYEDENGISHEVWYADDKTLQTWMSWISTDEEQKFSIWRLGE